MTQRVLFALVAIPLVLLLLWQGGVALVLLVCVAAALGTRELLEFARHQGVRPFFTLAISAAALLPALAWAAVSAPAMASRLEGWWTWGAMLWLILVLVVTLWRRSSQQKPLGAAAVTLFAPLYTGGLPAFLIPMRHGTYGTRSVAGVALVLFPMATVWICDSVAMAIGRRIGGARLAPSVSPGKTWSGTIAGFLAALLLAPIYTVLVFKPLHVDVSPWEALAMGAVIGVMGQVGDLAESLFKREAGLKDSSRLIPGHGGVLDRLDSLYFAIPLAALLYRAFGTI
ncbi:MAG TPA: phosphatidate cytidylyltransferase [Gemmatimonadales bacterium]|nr:phosphatidate cytidylyltransferase [Gemmatimonadales bacterium]